MRRFLALALLLVSSEASAATKNIWITQAEIDALPINTSAYTNMANFALKPNWDTTWVMGNQNPHPNQAQLPAAALYWMKTGSGVTRSRALREIKRLYRTYDTNAELDGSGSTTLGLSRNITPIVLAADMIDLESFDSAFNDTFKVWLDTLQTHRFIQAVREDRRTLWKLTESGSHNWSAFALAARIAINLYLGKNDTIPRCDSLFRALGDRFYYPTNSSVAVSGYFAHTADSGFAHLLGPNWLAYPSAGTNVTVPDKASTGCTALATTAAHDYSGANSQDIGRSPNMWPPCNAGAGSLSYNWESMQGYVCAAELLHRAGYPAYTYNNNMVYRMFNFIHRVSEETSWAYVINTVAGLERPVSYLINYRYGTNFYEDPNAQNTTRCFAWTSWTHARSPSSACAGLPNIVPGTGLMADPAPNPDPEEL